MKIKNILKYFILFALPNLVPLTMIFVITSSLEFINNLHPYTRSAIPALFWMTTWALAIIGAIFFKLGEFDKGSDSYVIGHHYEITTVSNNTVRVDEVEDYGGGSDAWHNFWLFVSRMFLLTFFGIIVFIFYIIRDLISSRENKEATKIIANIYKITGSILFIWIVLMFIAPLIAFRYLHYSLVIIIIIYSLLTITFLALKFLEKRKKIIFTIISLFLASIMIFAVNYEKITFEQTNSPDSIKSNIVINNIGDLEAIANIPCADYRNYELNADIDYHGKSSNFYGSIENLRGTFDGKKHTIKNINITKNFAKYAKDYGMILNNHGTIKNLNLDNIKIKIYCDEKGSAVRIGIVVGINHKKSSRYQEYVRKAIINNCNISNCELEINELKRNSDTKIYNGLSTIAGYDNTDTIKDNTNSNIENIVTNTSIIYKKYEK